MTSIALSPLALLGFGFALGLRHAADPDHVVAVTAIAVRTRRVWPAARLGAAWGLGHTLTLFTVGAGIILFNWVVPPRLGLLLEFVVALALVVVGLWNLRDLHPKLAERAPRFSGVPARRAFTVGLVHGLAGSAAVALLVLATVRDPRWACALGTLIGMALVSASVALPMAAFAGRWPTGPRTVRLATGALSLLFGLWLAFQIGWLDGLFTAQPTWHPH